MADKEVQNAKVVTTSVVTTGKKTTTTSSKAPVPKPCTSGSLVFPSGINTTTKDAAGTPPIKEILEILRVLNTNVNNQSKRMDKQDKRIDEMLSMWSEDYSDVNFGYDGSSSQIQENDEEQSFTDDSEFKSVFKRLSDRFQQQVDVDVHPDLASLVNSSFRNGLSEENLEEISKNIHRPGNCDSLVKTRVNQGIWRLLQSHTQSEDSRLVALQGVLIKASSNIVKLVEKLASAEPEHLELGTTALALLGHANKMINEPHWKEQWTWRSS